MECRRKAVPPTTTNNITCRLKRQYIDPETDERMCIYERGATGHLDLTVAMDKYFQCPRTQNCTQSPGSPGDRNTLDQDIKLIRKWLQDRRNKQTHERRMEQMRKNPYKRVDSENMTELEKMDQGFNGNTYTVNGIEVDF